MLGSGALRCRELPQPWRPGILAAMILNMRTLRCLLASVSMFAGLAAQKACLRMLGVDGDLVSVAFQKWYDGLDSPKAKRVWAQDKPYKCDSCCKP